LFPNTPEELTSNYRLKMFTQVAKLLDKKHLEQKYVRTTELLEHYNVRSLKG
jgi:hypothetical protein